MILRRAILPAVLAALALPAMAQDSVAPDPLELWQAEPTTVFDADQVTLDEFRWLARPVVVFADTSADPRFQRQMDLLAAQASELADRDVVVITDTNPDGRSSVRTDLRPRGFMLALLAKDGTVMLRKPFPWDVREITRSIDKLPLRQQEIRDRRETGG